MGYSVVCAEEAPFLDVTAGPDIADTFRPTTQAAVGTLPLPFEPGLCQAWVVDAADPRETEPVSSEIPTLVLAGTADIATPPAWSALAADTLPNSIYLEFPGLEHGLIGNNECLNTITLAFLDEPRSALDRSCIAALPQVSYNLAE